MQHAASPTYLVTADGESDLGTTKIFYFLRFQVLMAANEKITVIWIVTLCSLVEVY
jgi:hypothetical protein